MNAESLESGIPLPSIADAGDELDLAVASGRAALQRLYENFRRLVDAGLNDAAIARGRSVLVEYLEAQRWLAAGASVEAAADLQRTTPARVRQLRAVLSEGA